MPHRRDGGLIGQRALIRSPRDLFPISMLADMKSPLRRPLRIRTLPRPPPSDPRLIFTSDEAPLETTVSPAPVVTP